LDDVFTLNNESLVLIEASADVDGRTVYDEVVSVATNIVLELLSVASADIVVCDKRIEVEDCVDDVVCDTTVENVDGPVEVPTLLTD
jgi:hypothetical protein